MGEVNSQMLSSIISNNLIISKRLAVVDLFLVYSKTFIVVSVTHFILHVFSA